MLCPVQHGLYTGFRIETSKAILYGKNQGLTVTKLYILMTDKLNKSVPQISGMHARLYITGPGERIQTWSGNLVRTK